MRTKTLGRTGLETPIVGVGTMFTGFPVPDGTLSDLEMDIDLGVETIVTAVEAGATWIDTAPLYGGTVCETIIGKAMKGRPDLAEKCTVVTKAGNMKGGDHSYDFILKSVEDSLERLGMDSIDIVYIHDALKVPLEFVMGKDGAFAALRKLQDEGVVKFIGSATNDPQINVDYIETGEFDAAVVPNAWSLLNRFAEERILPAAEKHNTGITCGTPLERGLLATGPVEGINYVRRNFSPECVAQVGQMQEVCKDYDIPLLAASLQWPTRHPMVANVIPGARIPEEAKLNGEAGSVEISEVLWDELTSLVKHWPETVPFD